MKKGFEIVFIGFLFFTLAYFIFNSLVYISFDLLTGTFSNESVPGKITSIEKSYWGGINSKRVGSHGTYNYYFNFELNGEKYQSYSKGELNQYSLGDSVHISFMYENPNYSYIGNQKPKWIPFWASIIYALFFGFFEILVIMYIISRLKKHYLHKNDSELSSSS